MIGQAIRALRTTRGWTQQDLAERLGTSASSVVKWEAGAVEPRLRQLQALAHAFGSTIDGLVAGATNDGGLVSAGPAGPGLLSATDPASALASLAELRGAAEADRRTIEGLDAVERFAGQG